MDGKVDISQQCELVAQKAWLHQRRSGQQVEEGDFSLLLCSDEAPPRVLCSAVGCSAQERRGRAGVSPEVAAKMARGQERLFDRDSLGQLGHSSWKEKVSGKPHCSLPVL